MSQDKVSATRAMSDVQRGYFDGYLQAKRDARHFGLDAEGDAPDAYSRASVYMKPLAAPPTVATKLTISDLERLINYNNGRNVEILPDGSIREIPPHVEPRVHHEFGADTGYVEPIAKDWYGNRVIECARHDGLVWIVNGDDNEGDTIEALTEKEWNAAPLWTVPHVEAAKTVTRLPHDRPHSHVEPNAAEKKWEAAKASLMEDQGEPSAAESATCAYKELETKIAEAFEQTTVEKQKWEVLCLIQNYRIPAATEARMLELARKDVWWPEDIDQAWEELRALVIETFGEKPCD